MSGEQPGGALLPSLWPQPRRLCGHARRVSPLGPPSILGDGARCPAELMPRGAARPDHPANTAPPAPRPLLSLNRERGLLPQEDALELFSDVVTFTVNSLQAVTVIKVI